MKNWKRTSVITTLVVFLILGALHYIFNVRLSIPSSDITFSPGPETASGEFEHLGDTPENIIIFIADGMGFSHLSLALLTQQSQDTPSVWQTFDVKGWHDARSTYGPLTDSEASATAMATGTSTYFGHIGIDQDGNTLKSIFEIAAEKGYTTGIVTDSYIWDGTPAAFVAHTPSEDDARTILTQIASSQLDLLFGELEDLGEGEVPGKKESLEIIEERFILLDESLEIPRTTTPSQPIAAIFEEDEIQNLNSSPNLPQLTEVALHYLASKQDPFVLLVECEEMDSASHKNDSKRVVLGLETIQETLSAILSFSEKDGQTLVLFTSDHETGGLAAVADFGDYPNLQIRWSTKEHTAAVVPLLADGPGAHYFRDIQRNRDIGNRLIALIARE